MRYNISKNNSTKAERRVYELLKRLHIPFKHRWKIKNHEVDFIIGNYAIELDGHPQKALRNQFLVKEGYIPIHFTNNGIEETKLWLEQTFSHKEPITTAIKNG